MKRALFALLVLALIVSVPAWGQVSFVKVEPECRIYFSFAAIGTQTFDNRTQGCTYWVVTYSSFTFAGPLSIALQDAPNAAGSIPGAWVNFAGTVVSGVNPNVSTVGATSEFRGYYPWIRVNLTATGAGAGLLVGTAYGWRTGAPTTVTLAGSITVNQGTPNAGGAQSWPVYWGAGIVGADGVVNTVMQPVTVAGGTGPVMVAPYFKNQGTTLYDQFRGSSTGGVWVQGPAANAAAVAGNPVLTAGYDGANVRVPVSCQSRADISIGAAGTTQIVALVAAKSVRVCHLSISLSSSSDVSIISGTGANCAGGPTTLAGPYYSVGAMALDFDSLSPLVNVSADALCLTITNAGAVTTGGLITYAQF